MDQIRSLNFSLVDQGAGVALDIAMIKALTMNLTLMTGLILIKPGHS